MAEDVKHFFFVYLSIIYILPFITIKLKLKYNYIISSSLFSLHPMLILLLEFWGAPKWLLDDTREIRAPSWGFSIFINKIT